MEAEEEAADGACGPAAADVGEEVDAGAEGGMMWHDDGLDPPPEQLGPTSRSRLPPLEWAARPSESRTRGVP
jgi:hypothetical protein